MFGIDKYEKILAVLFLLSLPLVNPWVRGDGVGYYAFARSMYFEHRLDFEPDWQHANSSFRLGRLDADGHVLPTEITVTGHLDNHFAVGPAILWFPFLVAADLAVKINHLFGGQIPENGFSFPYMLGMAIGTAIYGFLALVLSYRLAKKYLPAYWAFLATLGIWLASSLPVYMYFNPSWSHAQSAFTVALFYWYWDRTRGARSLPQWLLLGVISGLMMDVYYINGVLLAVPLIESLIQYWQDLGAGKMAEFVRLFLLNLAFSIAVFATFFPTLLSKKIIYGGYLTFGYQIHWFFNSPAILKVAFSSEHGLFSWTPIILLAVVGMFLVGKRDRLLAIACVTGFAFYLYAIGCYEDWAGISSFGSRFFVSLTPIFVVGLAATFDSIAAKLGEARAKPITVSALAILALWNAGLIFQWGTHLIPARGPISWSDAAYNQVAVVPAQAARTVEAYLLHRKQLMGHIETQDLDQLKSDPNRGEP